MEKKYFITGGTGFVGSYLGVELLNKGLKVIFLSRSKNGISAKNRIINSLNSLNKGDFSQSLNFEVFEGDITKKALGLSNDIIGSFKNKIEGIWHLGANLSFNSKKLERSYEDNVIGTKNVLEFAKIVNSSIYFVSTAYVRGCMKEGQPEDDLIYPPCFNNIYEETKFEAEKLVRVWGKKSGNKFLIFRPSIIVGDSKTGFASTEFGYYSFVKAVYDLRKFLEINKNKKIFKLFGVSETDDGIIKAPIIYPYSNKIYLNFIPIDWLVDFMIKIVSKNIENKGFNLVSPDPCRLDKIHKDLFEGFKIKIHLISVPLIVIRTIFLLFRFLAVIFPVKILKSIGKNLKYFSPYIFNEVVYETKNIRNILGNEYYENTRFPDNFFIKTINKFIEMKKNSKNFKIKPETVRRGNFFELSPILDDIFKQKGVELPEYVFKKEIIGVGGLTGRFYRFLLKITKIFIKSRLKVFGSSYRKYKATPDHKEVEKIYHREAENYELKHHKTTNFRDTWWRRATALDLINFNKTKSRLEILDICTGIGLSAEEILRFFEYFGGSIKITGIDYNQSMLDQANKVILRRMEYDDIFKKGKREVEFLRADARNLTGKIGKESDLNYFEPNTFDGATIMFGIGGVDMPDIAFTETLSVIKPGGIFIMVDMHRPFIGLPEHWPWFLGKKHSHVFGLAAWEELGKPLVLGTLWGWGDPTPAFYTSRFAAVYDEEYKKYYGFDLLHFSILNEPWWFNFPVITTAKIVLKKVEISEEDFKNRIGILKRANLL